MTKVAQRPAVLETAPQITKCCGTCQGWRPLPSFPTLGQCMPSAVAGPSPVITSDLACCTNWPAAKK